MAGFFKLHPATDSRNPAEFDITRYVKPGKRMVKDLGLLKRCNSNHARTSHYSDDPRWYELCDEYGIYLMAESNLESHGYGRSSSEERFLKAYLDREVRAVQSYKNCTSVIIWSLGNESQRGDNLRKVMPVMRQLDPTRPIHYEGFGTGPNGSFVCASFFVTGPAGVCHGFVTGRTFETSR